MTKSAKHINRKRHIVLDCLKSKGNMTYLIPFGWIWLVYQLWMSMLLENTKSKKTRGLNFFYKTMMDIKSKRVGRIKMNVN